MKHFAPALAPVFVLALALVGCAAPAPADRGARTAAADGARKEGGKGGGMMDEMCKRHATEPGRAASAPGMMDKHCQARAEAPAAAASHVH
jgi:hypothetical protein